MNKVAELKEKMKKQMADENKEIEVLRGKIVLLINSGVIDNDKAVATKGWLQKDHPIEKWRTLYSNLLPDPAVA
jgi:hypothetical protein